MATTKRTGKGKGTHVTSPMSQLAAWRDLFDAGSAKKKYSLLERLQQTQILNAKVLVLYHDLLCFMRAYPDNRRLLRLVESELKSFGKRVDAYRTDSRDSQGLKLVNTGIVNTTTVYAFGYGVIRHLLRRHREVLAVDWEETGEEIPDNLFSLLPLLVSWQENDALDNDDYFDTAAWLQLARGEESAGDLDTIADLFAGSELPPSVQNHLYDSLDISITWDLTATAASRTRHRVPSGKVFYQKEALRRRSPDLRQELQRPPTPLRRVTLREGREYVQTINEVLAVRNRELYPLTFANPAEVYINDPGRGLRLVIFGCLPEIRLPLESNFGALLVRNGMPVGYGVAATLFDRVEIAINIFPAYRGAESPYIIEQFFRAFYHHFDSRVFLVRSTQMGHGEDEALYSGAFWFYYKLGFRAINKRIRNLADRESDKIRSRADYRVPIKTMKKLANTDVFFHIDPDQMDDYRELPIVNLGYLVSQYLAERFNGNRRQGIPGAVRQVQRRLKIRNPDRWSESEIRALNRLAPLVANIADLGRWPEKDKQHLVRIIRAKGGRQERRYVLQSNRHARFKNALSKLAAGYSVPDVANDWTGHDGVRKA